MFTTIQCQSSWCRAIKYSRVPFEFCIFEFSWYRELHAGTTRTRYNHLIIDPNLLLCRSHNSHKFALCSSHTRAEHSEMKILILSFHAKHKMLNFQTVVSACLRINIAKNMAPHHPRVRTFCTSSALLQSFTTTSSTCHFLPFPFELLTSGWNGPIPVTTHWCHKT